MRLARISLAKASGLSIILCGGLSEAQQQEGYEGDGDLDAHGVLGGAEKAGDLQRLFDPAEEQLDRPAALVEIGDLLRAGVEVVGQQTEYLAGLGPDPHLAHRVGHRAVPVVRLAWRRSWAVCRPIEATRCG